MKSEPAQESEPANKSEPTNKSEADNISWHADGVIGYVDCVSLEPIFRESPDGGLKVALKCRERVEVIGENAARFIVRTTSGTKALLERSLFSAGQSSPSQVAAAPASSSMPRPPSPASQLPQSMIVSLAYRVLPQQSTTYIKVGEYSSSSTCYGQGEAITDSLARLSMNCDTTYSSPAQIPLNWRFADVYNQVETATHRLLLHCRASWRWSKCAPLIPGNVFQFESQGSDMFVIAFKDGNPEKKVRVKYRILQSELK